MTLRLLTYNVLRGGKGREELLTSVVVAADADIVVLQETAGGSLFVDLARSGYRYSEVASDGRFGMKVAIVSRLPIVRAVSVPLVPFLRGTECALVADMQLRDGQTVTVVGVHLHALYAFPMEGIRRFQLGVLRRWLRDHVRGRHVLAGDFNAFAVGDAPDLAQAPLWVRAQTWPQLGRLPRWGLRQVERDGYVDCYRRLHPGDPGFTLPASRPHVRIDYVFADRELARQLVGCEVFSNVPAASSASDHLPVLATFEMCGVREPLPTIRQSPPTRGPSV